MVFISLRCDFFIFVFVCLFGFLGLANISVYITNGSEILYEGGYVSLYCNAPAYPEPTVTWSKLNADGITMVSNWLNFTNIGREEAGNYICMAKNTCGKKKSSMRNIDVQRKEVILLVTA